MIQFETRICTRLIQHLLDVARQAITDTQKAKKAIKAKNVMNG
jgi:hypothetical protein